MVGLVRSIHISTQFTLADFVFAKTVKKTPMLCKHFFTVQQKHHTCHRMSHVEGHSSIGYRDGYRVAGGVKHLHLQPGIQVQV